MISPYPTYLIHLKPCNHPTPLTLPFLYFGFCPKNPWKMIENEMKVFCNLLRIYLLHYSLYSLDLFNSQWFNTHLWLCNFDLLLTNSTFGFISRGCILDTFSSIAKIISTCSCSWIIYGSLSSWPPPLRSCGFSICTSSSWTISPLKFCGSLVCTSSSLAILLGLALASSSLSNA